MPLCEWTVGESISVGLTNVFMGPVVFESLISTFHKSCHLNVDVAYNVSYLSREML